MFSVPQIAFHNPESSRRHRREAFSIESIAGISRLNDDEELSRKKRHYTGRSYEFPTYDLKNEDKVEADIRYNRSLIGLKFFVVLSTGNSHRSESFFKLKKRILYTVRTMELRFRVSLYAIKWQ